MPLVEVHIADMTDVEIVAEAERRQAAGEREHAAELRRFIAWRHEAIAVLSAQGVPARKRGAVLRRAIDGGLAR